VRGTKTRRRLYFRTKEKFKKYIPLTGQARTLHYFFSCYQDVPEPAATYKYLNIVCRIIIVCAMSQLGLDV